MELNRKELPDTRLSILLFRSSRSFLAIVSASIAKDEKTKDYDNAISEKNRANDSKDKTDENNFH